MKPTTAITERTIFLKREDLLPTYQIIPRQAEGISDARCRRKDHLCRQGQIAQAGLIYFRHSRFASPRLRKLVRSYRTYPRSGPEQIEALILEQADQTLPALLQHRPENERTLLRIHKVSGEISEDSRDEAGEEDDGIHRSVNEVSEVRGKHLRLIERYLPFATARGR